jgi:hypothetical protein
MAKVMRSLFNFWYSDIFHFNLLRLEYLLDIALIGRFFGDWLAAWLKAC